MRAGLVGKQIGDNAAAREFRDDVRAIAHQSHRHGMLLAHRILENADRFIQRIDADVAVACADAALDALRVNFDAEEGGAVQRGGQRLRSTHAAHAARHHQFAGQVAAEVLLRGGGEGFIGALENALRADVNPTPRRHLAVHHQAQALELAEFFPGGPVAHQIGVGNQHARSSFVRLENSHRLSRLHQERLIIAEALQRRDDGVVARPIARRLARAAIDD